MDTLPSGQWTKQQLFVQVCYPNPARVANQPFGESTFTGQKQSGIHRSHQWLGCCQGDSPMGVEHETFQKPKARESHPPDNHKSITHALAQFGTPCAHAQHASRPIMLLCSRLLEKHRAQVLSMSFTPVSTILPQTDLQIGSMPHTTMNSTIACHKGRPWAKCHTPRRYRMPLKVIQ